MTFSFNPIDTGQNDAQLKDALTRLSVTQPLSITTTNDLPTRKLRTSRNVYFGFSVVKHTTPSRQHRCVCYSGRWRRLQGDRLT
ncbi:MAG: hypothetical protein R3E01_33095 [Pirellulaceae bacterium]